MSGLLTPGSRVGSYAVLSKLGEGGMGEVYRARDTRLKRDVALKVLPEHFTADPDRMARFQREAEVLAALNRPHIAQIHGIEESSDVRALVMELVEGADLAERLARGPGRSSSPLSPVASRVSEPRGTAECRQAPGGSMDAAAG
jgi:serine/threonine protein kinase